MKQLKIRIFPNGLIQTETGGIKGKACLSYVKVLEQLTDARPVDSDFTSEYYERDNLLETGEEDMVDARHGN